MTITRRSMFLTPLAALAGKVTGMTTLHHSGSPLLSWDAAKFIDGLPCTVEEIAKTYQIPVSLVMIEKGNTPYYYADRKAIMLLESMRKRRIIERLSNEKDNLFIPTQL